MRRDPHVSQPLALKIGVQPAHVPLVDRIDQARHLTDRPIRCLAQCANGLHRLHGARTRSSAVRLHSGLGYRSPITYEADMQAAMTKTGQPQATP